MTYQVHTKDIGCHTRVQIHICELISTKTIHHFSTKYAKKKCTCFEMELTNSMCWSKYPTRKVSSPQNHLILYYVYLHLLSSKKSQQESDIWLRKLNLLGHFTIYTQMEHLLMTPLFCIMIILILSRALQDQLTYQHIPQAKIYNDVVKD